MEKSEMVRREVRQRVLLVEKMAVRGIGAQSIFFFDGKFRTWSEVQARASLNQAIADQVRGFANHDIWN